MAVCAAALRKVCYVDSKPSIMPNTYNRMSRRNLLAASAGGLITRALVAQESPDLVVFNARVITVDPRQPSADAFAVSNGRFLAVGSNADIRNLIRQGTAKWDAQGSSIVPGFIDTHNHAGGTTLLYEVLVGNPFEVEFVTIDSIIQKLRARAAQTPPGFWVEGYFFDDTKVKDGRQLNIHDLDQVSKDHPVAVHHRGGHTSFYNSKAFELADVNSRTPNPPGGTFDKDSSGALNGRVTDTAKSAFARAGKRQTRSDPMQREIAGVAHISKMFARYGVTTVHHEGGTLAAMQKVRANGDLKHRISYEAMGKELDALLTAGVQSGFGDEWIRFGATSEHTVDGSFSERTMALSVAYPGTSYKGNITTTQEDLNAWVEKVHRAGFQVNCHANGDVAIDMYLTACERAQKLFPRADARPKITHCTLINDDLVRRMKSLDAVPSLFTTYAYYNSDKFAFYGEELMKRSMAFRTLLDNGIHAAAGSDFSPGPFDPRMAIQGMVTRTGWDGKTWGANQKISVDEAIRVNTLNGAYNSHEEKMKGSITAGKLADYVVLAEDLHTMPVERIKDVKIVRTVVGGKTVYEG
ncbi:MAG: amidohydrolase [Acidobacteriaceae bacterium]|nr:amidohydrolase [Acidobacteriaceae bacterium]